MSINNCKCAVLNYLILDQKRFQNFEQNPKDLDLVFHWVSRNHVTQMDVIYWLVNVN